MYQPDMSPSDSRWSYLKVAEQIRQEILNGTYKAGKRLPGEPVLAERFGVGRVTIARALDVLEQSNLVFRVRGSGTYIQRDVARGAVRLTIGYLVNDMDVLHGSPSGITLEAAHQRIEELGHTTRLLTRGELLATGEPPATLRRMVRAGALNGLILSYQMPTGITCRISEVLPMIILLTDNLPENMFNVPVDFAAGYFRATRHLLDLGHRQVGLLGGSRQSTVGYRAYMAWRLALQAAGLDPACQPICQCGFDRTQYRPHADTMLRQYPDMTGLVCIDDLAAITAIEAACALGRSVPRDISVVGCNDAPAALTSTPPLTTLHIDFAEMGRRAVDLLLSRIFGRQASQTVYIEPQLVVRGSTAPPPSP